MDLGKRKRLNIQIAPEVFLHLALLLLILPLRCIISFVLAAVIHEFGHLSILKLLKVRIYRIRIGVLGTVIETEEVTQKQELLSAMAGPIAGLITCLTARFFPILAICAFVQTAYNLLPVYPFDGGRVCRILSGMLFPRKIPCKDDGNHVE